MKALKTFKEVCKVGNQYALKALLHEELKEFYPEDTIVNEDGFLYVPSINLDVMLTAHMDTVNYLTVCETICKKKLDDGTTMFYSDDGYIGGDDRCGIWMILHILRHTDYRPAIVFCEDEEIGCVGSGKFADWLLENEEARNVKFIVELDRRNATDAVFYQCGNKDFIKFVTETTGYKEECGSYSDICQISPALDVASVNLSCGYYHEHTLQHYVIADEMYNTIEATKKLLAKADEVSRFDYQKKTYTSYYGSYGYGSSLGHYYGKWDDDYDDYDEYGGYYNYLKKQSTKVSEPPVVVRSYMVMLYKNGGYIVDYEDATSSAEALGKCMMAYPEYSYDEVEFLGTEEEYEEKYQIVSTLED